MKMMTSSMAFGLKRVVLSFNKPVSHMRLLCRNANAFAILLRWPRHTFTPLGPFDLSVCLGRCFSKEITATPTGTNSEKDILLERLLVAKCVPDVLETVGAHHSIMNRRHLLQALESLFRHRKLDGFSTEILTTPQFAALCKRLKFLIRGIELNEAVDALKIVTHFGLDSSNVLVKALLDIIRHKVNDLSLQQIAFVQYLMSKMEASPMVEALQIALPLVFELQFNTKLDRTNIHHLVDMLQYASQTEVSKKSLETLIESLTILTNSGKTMDMRTAKAIVISLTSKLIARRVPAEVLVQRCLTTLAEKIEECNMKDIDVITTKLARHINKNHMEFYNEDFMDRCSTYVIKKDCGVPESAWILRSLTLIGHVNFDLLNYLAKKIVADPSQLTDCRPFTLLTLVTGFAEANYKPDDWHIICDLILNHPLLKEGPLELPWIKFALELAALGCFSSVLLERIFEEHFLKRFLGREDNYLDMMRLLRLHQAVVTLFPSYGGPFPPQDILNQSIAKEHHNHEKHECPLEAALVRGLGGAAYLQSKLFTRSHIFVDHVIVMRQGGFPIALSPPTNPDGSKVCVEDLEVPANSQIIVVFGLRPRFYTLSSNRMRGNACLQIRILEALNLAVVPVSLQLWSKMPEHERIPYLMQSIKYKCEESADVSVKQ